MSVAEVKRKSAASSASKDQPLAALSAMRSVAELQKGADGKPCCKPTAWTGDLLLLTAYGVSCAAIWEELLTSQVTYSWCCCVAIL